MEDTDDTPEAPVTFQATSAIHRYSGKESLLL